MKVHIKYFASIRETIGVANETLDSSAATVAELRNLLAAREGAAGAALARGRAMRVALDQVMCDESAALHAGCEVAFFPPVTGG